MTEFGKIIILVGAVLMIIGAVIWALGRAGFRGLPGDVAYEGSSVRIYFPIVTCIVLSILLTTGVWLWRRLSGR
jgi:hypothetical protein